MTIIKLDSTDSTNNWAALHEAELTMPSLVYAREQVKGRGQRGNSWESAPGKNITASLIFRPSDFPASLQFAISEAVAMAIHDFLDELGVESQIKWPNDIYVGDKKICGILVEHVVLGRNISRTIAGFGININQMVFMSDAPNPISLKMLTGKDYDIDECIEKLSLHLNSIESRIKDFYSLHGDFLNNLWRKDGNFYKFYDRKREEYIEAAIFDVLSQGTLMLSTKNGELREYSFKEVEFLI